MDKNLKTLESAINAMREKIEQQIPVFKEEPLAQSVIVNTGEEVLRQNPNVSEFRALVKDYGQTIKVYRELAGDEKSADISSLEEIRARFKVAK